MDNKTVRECLRSALEQLRSAAFKFEWSENHEREKARKKLLFLREQVAALLENDHIPD